jgi:hypothetical protein
MTYPTLPINAPGKQGRETDRQIDRATNGAARARVFYSTPKRTFDIEHAYLTAEQKATFDAFYNANLSASFAFVWPGDGVTYTCIFASDPTDTAHSGNYTSISVTLTEV